MRVLLAHSFYGSAAPSGENRVFETERDLLRRRGHEVRELVRHGDELRSRGALGAIRGGLATPWNPFEARRMRAAVAAFRPDVVHVHNTFPLLSPAVFRAIPPGVGRLLTLHNCRLFCPGATLLRDGRLCTDCLDRRSVLPALRHGCYRGSRLATAPIAASVWLHRALGTWQHHVDRFIFLNSFQRDLMVKAGLPAARACLKPNFYPGDPAVVPWSERGDYALFAGRLEPEKGVESLVRAWLAWGEGAPELRVAGAGSEEAALRALAATRPGVRVAFLGQLPSPAAELLIARARLLVLPSRALEGFPMVIREAFAFGTPVAVAETEPLPAIVERGVSGVVFRPGDPAALLACVRAAWERPGELERLAAGARAAFDRLYCEKVGYEGLMRVYDEARSAARQRGDA